MQNTTTTAFGNVRKQLPTILIGSLTLIATLAWNDALQSVIVDCIPAQYRTNQGSLGKVIYALILTCIIATVIGFILILTSGGAK